MTLDFQKLSTSGVCPACFVTDGVPCWGEKEYVVCLEGHLVHPERFYRAFSANLVEELQRIIIREVAKQLFESKEFQLMMQEG